MATAAVLYLLNSTDDDPDRRIVIAPRTFDGAGGVQYTTDLTFYGNGAPNWGERFNENFYHLLENFATAEKGGSDGISTLPAPPTPKSTVNLGAVASAGVGINKPIEGQMWYNKSRGVMFVYTSVESGGIGDKQWKPASNVLVADDDINRDLIMPAPRVGEIILNKASGELEVYNGIAWVTSGDLYVNVAGDTMTGYLILNANPIAPLGAATKQYVDAQIGGIGGASLDALTDVTISSPSVGQYLRKSAGDWVNSTIVLTDISGISGSLTAAELNFMDGVTSSVQTQLNAKLNINGTSTMTGALNMGNHLINNVVDPVSAQDAATKKYVDDITAGGSSSTILLASGQVIGGTTVPFPVGYNETNSFIIATFHDWGGSSGHGLDLIRCYTTVVPGVGWAVTGLWSRDDSGSNTNDSVDYWVFKNGAPLSLVLDISLANESMSYSTDSVTSPTVTTAFAGFRLKTTGEAKLYYGNNITPNTEVATSSVWMNPGYTPTNYQVRATLSAGSVPSGSALGTWLPLGSVEQSWYVTAATLPSTATATLYIEIRNLSGTILDNGTISLYAQRYTSGGGGGGGGGGSVLSSAYLPFVGDKRAGELVSGDPLLLLSEDRTGTKDGTVISNRLSTQNLLTLVSESGIELTCSDNTPLTLEDGTYINSTDVKGRKLPVQDENGFRWETITDVIPCGRGEVATIFCLDQCYAAGNVPGRWIWTHNMPVAKF